ncbi:MAG: four-carbon acid sugar kinase family protein [Dysgonamonadaceae bacterium]|jgi:uncharacterized protein YgbK (DUF1537 family)|nr:four-carbon acid sugar kinase family protein [Dysgonamonadaceae bacterium]
MLTVLADDITGAAEIAGVCLRFGLSVTFDFDFNIQGLPATDVWIIASDTRSLPEQEACDTVRKTARCLQELQVRTVFKKIDSALRGHIVPEIKALQEYIPVEEAFILPANPENGRIIREGNYYINEKPLHQTAFARDPDFPAKTASVRALLQLTENNTQWLTPDIISPTDYKTYSLKIRQGILPAGGSAFFEQYVLCHSALDAELRSNRPDQSPENKRGMADQVRHDNTYKATNLLMICGSTHDNSRCFIRNDRQFQKIEIPRKEVQEYLYTDKSERFIRNAVSIFDKYKKLLLSVETGKESAATASEVKRLLAKITQALLSLCPVEELMIEGGATAYACLQATGFSSLVPVKEYARGVVRLKISGKDNLFLTIKPGSYEWPEKIIRS